MNKVKVAIVTAAAVAIGSSALTMTNANAAVKISETDTVYTKAEARECAQVHAMKVIRKGDKTVCVRVLRALINLENEKLRKENEKKGIISIPENYTYLSPSSTFDTATDNAVRLREKRLGWKVDGLVGKGHFNSLAKIAPDIKLTDPIGKTAPVDDPIVRIQPVTNPKTLPYARVAVPRLESE